MRRELAWFLVVAVAALVSWFGRARDLDRARAAELVVQAELGGGQFEELAAPIPDRPQPGVCDEDGYPPLASLAPTESFEADFHFCGTASCAASNCHGGDRSGMNRPPQSVDGHRHRFDRNRSGNTTWGGEYATWLHRDPHARAYEVLFDPRSVEMAKKLGICNAHESNRCLNCHAVNVQPPTDDRVHANQPSLADGVGCEACHGPAGKWLDLHKQTNWPSLTPEQKADAGFWNLDDVLTRTKVCVSCHVGGPGRDVDHDLIAAGHPRMNFEMSAYQSLMPNHWSEVANLRQPYVESRDIGEFDAKSWALGQAVAAEATVLQTARRADAERSRDPHAVWPEFSETGCFACHHDLALELPLGEDDLAGFLSWRQDRGFDKRRAGSYPWGTWSTPLLTSLADDPAINAGLQEQLATLRLLMSKPRPDAEQVVPAAVELADTLRTLTEQLDRADYGAGARRVHVERMGADARKFAQLDWDAATQAWLALAALERAETSVGNGNVELRLALGRIRDRLEFPSRPSRFASPRDFGESLQKLREDYDSLPGLIQR